MHLGDFEIPGVEPEPGAWASWPPGAKWAAGCGAGCAVLVLIGALAFWGMMAMVITLHPPRGLTAVATAPKAVTVGQKFPLTLVLKNGSSETVTVTNVTVRGPTLSEFSIKNPTPAPPSSFAPSLPNTKFWSYQQT